MANDLWPKIWAYIKHHYNTMAKRDPRFKQLRKMPRFNEDDVETGPEDLFPDGSLWATAWHAIPNYMIDLRKFMHPVAALDVGHSKHPGQGSHFNLVTAKLTALEHRLPAAPNLMSMLTQC